GRLAVGTLSAAQPGALGVVAGPGLVAVGDCAGAGLSAQPAFVGWAPRQVPDGPADPAAGLARVGAAQAVAARQCADSRRYVAGVGSRYWCLFCRQDLR